MKVTIVTVVLNCADYIGDCIRSVISQDYEKLEHIVVDGGSTDGTLSVIDNYKAHISCLLSECDGGNYEALNKGIKLATGDLIGILNADDLLAGIHVVSSIVACAKQNGCDAVYANLNVIKRSDKTRVIRRWRSKQYVRRDLEMGWMPPHPTLFVRKEILSENTGYSRKYGCSGDYDFILQLFYHQNIKAIFLDELVVCMRSGGLSNGSLAKMWRTLRNDYRVLVNNRIPNAWLAVILKRIRKAGQFSVAVRNVIS